MRDDYYRDGYIGPFQAVKNSEIPQISVPKSSDIQLKRNQHLYRQDIRNLCLNSAIIESSKKILGSDLILWRSNLFRVSYGAGFGWHQDQYQGLLIDPLNHISIHLAITQATPKNCLSIIPGTHKLSHQQILDSGFRMKKDSDKDDYGTPTYWRTTELHFQPKKLLLKPGEFIVFHPNILHGSLDLSDLPSPKANPFKNLIPAPDRIAIAMRITVPGNRVLPKAFAETLPRIDKCFLLAGSNQGGVNELAE